MIEPSFISEILIPPDKLQDRIAELGAAISRDYEGQDLLLLAVLKGSVLFLADLMRSSPSRTPSTSWQPPVTATRSIHRVRCAF